MTAGPTDPHGVLAAAPAAGAIRLVKPALHALPPAHEVGLLEHLDTIDSRSWARTHRGARTIACLPADPPLWLWVQPTHTVQSRSGDDDASGALATGQVRPTDQLVDPMQVQRPGAITAYLEPLFEDGLEALPPG